MKKSMDGNTAAAHIAYAFSEIAAIYPITPSTSMGELAEQWAAEGRKNIFGRPMEIVEMQSEAGAAGAVHGALSAGTFSTTFTASQGLLLMIPNMYKIAGELLPTVFHVSARAVAGQALSIFGDHQDVMATRSCGFCMLASSSVQEAMDLALVAHLASIRASLPFLHFFDGFRTSHEIQKIEEIGYGDIKGLLDENKVKAFRDRGLNPNHPYLKGTAQNPDIYFQLMEAANRYYLAVPEIIREEMERLYKLSGRQYSLFDYVGHPQAEKVIVMMGSGAEVAHEVVDYLVKGGKRVGLVKVRLFRPFSKEDLVKVLPQSVKKIAALDRTKESGSLGEPLYLDLCAALQNRGITIVGGRYGLGSKDFTPAMVRAVFDNLDLKQPKESFTVGIVDDITYTSLPVGENLNTKSGNGVGCKFYGLGGDGTVGANKDAIKIIGDNTDKYVQGYFVYDSRKTSGLTISYLRFGDKPIRSSYLIYDADYIACHHPSYVKKYDILEGIKEGGIFVLNSPWSVEEMEMEFSGKMKRIIAQKRLHLYNIDALAIAKEIGLGTHINMIMQASFFKLANILPLEKAIKLLKEAIEKIYLKKGEQIVDMNKRAVDRAIESIQRITYPPAWRNISVEIEKGAVRPEFIRKVADVMDAQRGDILPVSSFTAGGAFPMATSRYEKRGVATSLPKWDPQRCLQCNQCSFVCPHGAIRPFLLTPQEVLKTPQGYTIPKAKGKQLEGLFYSLEISPLDCTGCGNCVNTCPAYPKALEMQDIKEVTEEQKRRWDYLFSLKTQPEMISKFTVRGSQFSKPLLEFSGACAGCGETPYVKLLTQLFGSRMIISNATGCSSIWGGSAPFIPWCMDDGGRGPAWANSLFEDNAEHGLGIEMATSYRREELADIIREAVHSVDGKLGQLLKDWLIYKEDGEKNFQISEKILQLLTRGKRDKILEEIYKRADLLSKPSIWIIGGDGWAYDIGFGGLDHVLSLGRDVNILVLDTEVYSNTGGQASKATPLGAIAKFAALGKKSNKKNLGAMAMVYGNVYVASVSMGGDKQQVIRAMKEAESYSGPSIIIAYCSCVNHGIKGGMERSQEEEKRAVDAGYWINYRYDPRRKGKNKNSFQLDSKEISLDLNDFILGQLRYSYLQKIYPQRAKILEEELKGYLEERFKNFKHLESSSSELLL